MPLPQMFYNLAGFVEGPRMLMSLETAVPLFMIATVPGEVAFAVGSAGATAIIAQWRAREKDREASIAAITKNSLTQDRLLTTQDRLLANSDALAKDVADIKAAMAQPSAGESQIIHLLTEIRQELKSRADTGEQRAASG